MNKVSQASQNKNSRIALSILSDINSAIWVPGDRLPPERELAERFSCTRATIRSALKQLEAQGIINRITGSGTYVADSYQPPQQVRQIAVIVIVGADGLSDDPHFSAALLGMHSSPVINHCQLKVIKLQKGERIFTHFKQNNISLEDFDGLFFLSYDLNDSEIRKLKRFKSHFIGTAPSLDGIEKMSYVFIDNSDGIYMATSHLLDLGKKRPALFTLTASEKVTSPEASMTAGFKRALTAYDLPVNDDDIRELSLLDHNQAYRDMTELIKTHSNIDSIVCYGGRITYGACQAIRDAGLRIPQDIAVVMYNDFPWASDLLNLPLTAVKPPYGQQAHKGLEMLMRKISENDTSFSIELIQPQLIVRQSCGYNQKQGEK